MLVSIVIPAYRAEVLLPDALRSVLSQTMNEWECIVVSDDGVDYRPMLSSWGISDPRVRCVSTGVTGAGCHSARNRGLAECRGDVICALDADDVWMPRRLEVLAPQAMEHGAAVDSPCVVNGSEKLYCAFESFAAPFMLDVRELLSLTCPIFPLTRRDVTFRRTPGIEYLEDVVSNLLLISSNGPMWATPEWLMNYRVVDGSMCHGNNSAARFDQAYADIMEQITNGSLAIADGLCAKVLEGLQKKRQLNKRFGDAQRLEGSLNFQVFAAAQRAGRQNSV